MLWGSNIQLYFWKCWPCSVKIQQRDIMSKVSKKDRCLWCLLQIQPYSSSEGFLFCNVQISWRVAHQQGKEQQGWNISLGHLVCLPEVFLGSIKQPFNKLLVWVKRHRETQWVFLLRSSRGNSSVICIILGKREQSLRVWFLPGVIKLFITQLAWSTWVTSVKLCLCTSLDHSQSDCVLQNWDASELLRMKWRGTPCHLALGKL